MKGKDRETIVKRRVTTPSRRPCIFLASHTHTASLSLYTTGMHTPLESVWSIHTGHPLSPAWVFGLPPRIPPVGTANLTLKGSARSDTQYGQPTHWRHQTNFFFFFFFTQHFLVEEGVKKQILWFHIWEGFFWVVVSSLIRLVNERQRTAPSTIPHAEQYRRNNNNCMPLTVTSLNHVFVYECAVKDGLGRGSSWLLDASWSKEETDTCQPRWAQEKLAKEPKESPASQSSCPVLLPNLTVEFSIDKEEGTYIQELECPSWSSGRGCSWHRKATCRPRRRRFDPSDRRRMLAWVKVWSR